MNDTLKIFNVHKYKLMAHSEVFRAMLSHGDMITEARVSERILIFQFFIMRKWTY